MARHDIDIVAAREALNENYILVLTTNSVERDAVSKIMSNAVSAAVSRNTRGARIGFLGNRFCIHLNGAAGAQDADSIGSLTRWMTQAPRPLPQLVLVVGFAWGNPDLVQVGDVIIASKIYDISPVRMINGVSKRRIADRTSSLGSIEPFLADLTASHIVGKAVCGELASAEIYLSDTEERNAILRQLPDVLGGEMEAFDVVRDLQVPWLFIKAVSDDGGDDVDREQQAIAAGAAASLVLPVLDILTKEGLLETSRDDRASRRLSDALIGQAIRISRPAGTRGPVVDAMNAEVPRLMRRLLGYAPADAGQEAFAETLAVALVEIAQNAFLHGNASHVTCAFNETSISLSDDGSTYDPANLTGQRGGASAWKALKTEFLDLEQIGFSRRVQKPRGNSYKFKFSRIDTEIRNAKERCALTTANHTFGDGAPGFVFDPTCDTLYYDATDIFSMSKRFSVDAELLKLLEAGKSLIVACRNESQAATFEHSLAYFAGPKLRIFVMSRL